MVDCKCETCGKHFRLARYMDCGSVVCSCTAFVEPRDPLTCLHFLGPTGEATETHKHCGCKTATPMTALAECELHGTCTFIGRAKDERIAFCGDCKDYRLA